MCLLLWRAELTVLQQPLSLAVPVLSLLLFSPETAQPSKTWYLTLLLSVAAAQPPLLFHGFGTESSHTSIFIAYCQGSSWANQQAGRKEKADCKASLLAPELLLLVRRVCSSHKL